MTTSFTIKNSFLLHINSHFNYFINILLIFFTLIFILSCAIDENLIDEYKNIVDTEELVYNFSSIECAISLYNVSKSYKIDVDEKILFKRGNNYNKDMAHLLVSSRNCLSDIENNEKERKIKKDFYNHISSINALHRFHHNEGVLVVFSPDYSVIYFLRGNF